MLVFREIMPDLIPAACLALGMFDGVHLGHQKVILDAVHKAKNYNALSTVLTFAVHPQSITSLRPSSLITNLDQRLEIFESLGVQAVVILNFNEELAKMTAENYIKNVLVDALKAKSITIGYNHRFGANKSGNSELLQQFSQEYGFEVSIIDQVIIDNNVVSSSLIRNLISAGETASAAKLLGRPFCIKNTVIHGMQRGRMLGFPTANLTIPDNIIVPKPGVYSGIVDIKGNIYNSVINVGKRPTFGDLTENLIEAHILGFDGDLYGLELEVCFLDRLRDERKFNSEADLRDQIKKDCQMVTVCPVKI